MPEPPPDAPRRRFIVATLDETLRRQQELRQVQARSHEEAVAVVAATRGPARRRFTYEVWPATEPRAILRITIEPREKRRPFPA